MEERRNKRLGDDANASELPNQSVKKSAAAEAANDDFVVRKIETFYVFQLFLKYWQTTAASSLFIFFF